MTTSEYMADIDCYKTFTSLREAIYNKHRIATKAPTQLSASLYKSPKVKKPSVSLSEYKSDKSVILAIQNDVRFINIIMNCRKQRSPIALMFVESNRCISCIIKNANGYPLVFIRIPIDDVYAFAQNTNNVYEFPIQGLLSKDVKYNKSSSYTILFKYDGQKVNFIYELYSGNAEPNRIIIESISTHNETAINNIFKSDLIANSSQLKLKPYISSGILSQESTNYLLAFYNMNVNILREVQDTSSIIQFNHNQTPKTLSYFEIENGRMIFVMKNPKSTSDIYICSSDDSIIWTETTGECKRYDLLPYESQFKNNYNKSITSNDKVYYAFTAYLNNYIFIKVVTPYDIGDAHDIKSFAKIFSREYQILECYFCTKHEEETEDDA